MDEWLVRLAVEHRVPVLDALKIGKVPAGT